LDGIAAAAIVARYLRLHGKDWRLGAAIGRADTDIPVRLSTIKNSLIHILDIQANQISHFDATMKILLEHNRIAYWSSDMPCDEQTAEKIRGSSMQTDIVTKRSQMCTAEMTRQRFLPQDQTAQILADVARDIKLWQRSDENAVKLADVVASGYDRKNLIEMLSKGVTWSDTLETVRMEYMLKKENALSELLKNFVIKDYVGVKFGFALAANLLPSADACQFLLDKNVAVGVAVAVYRDGRIVFRRRNGVDVDLEMVAKLFEGGGREYASGGRLRGFNSVSGESFEKVMFAIDRTLKDFFLG
jgi:oligoribonuclease NrnB/cAMP/cGMP phosphodiesterase (DHH superfamily)